MCTNKHTYYDKKVKLVCLRGCLVNCSLWGVEDVFDVAWYRQPIRVMESRGKWESCGLLNATILMLISQQLPSYEINQATVEHVPWGGARLVGTHKWTLEKSMEKWRVWFFIHGIFVWSERRSHVSTLFVKPLSLYCKSECKKKRVLDSSFSRKKPKTVGKHIYAAKNIQISPMIIVINRLSKGGSEERIGMKMSCFQEKHEFFVSTVTKVPNSEPNWRIKKTGKAYERICKKSRKSCQRTRMESESSGTEKSEGSSP